MSNKHSSQSILPPEIESVEAVDVGQTSNAYNNEADREAVHDAYERGNEAAAQKNEPPFDNRTGFADVPGGSDQEVYMDASAVAPKPDQSSGSDGLNNPSAPPPADSNMEHTPAPGALNDSIVAPEKSQREAMRGFHGG